MLCNLAGHLRGATEAALRLTSSSRTTVRKLETQPSVLIVSQEHYRIIVWLSI